MPKISEHALAELKLQLDSRPTVRGSGDEGNVVTPIIEKLLVTLEFGQLDRVPQFKANSSPSRKSDIACRYPDKEGNNFFQQQKDPFLLVELKSTGQQLSLNSPHYWKAFAQLKEQLLGNNAMSAHFGLISNGWELQLFKRFHKVVHPATSILSLNTQNAQEVSNCLLRILQEDKRGIIIGVYNNKGGIGKTTLTTNLGIVLAQSQKKVLLVDFDPNQADLTDSLQQPVVEGKVWNFLKGKVPGKAIIQHCSFSQGKQQVQFDLIPADKSFLESHDVKIQQEIRLEFLRNRLKELSKDYDYILIDMPPNWRWFAQAGVQASDTLLVPASHIDRASLRNLEALVTNFIPQVNQRRAALEEGGPNLLPLVLNQYQHTDAQARNCYRYLADIVAKNNEWKDAFNNFFYMPPKRFRRGQHCFELPYKIEICRAPLEGPKYVPAPLRYRRAKQVYEHLIREVLL
ncbi:ParA family protein [Acaryochloris marina]|nr:ParA family protein [Acaryochloris marina]